MHPVELAELGAGFEAGFNLWRGFRDDAAHPADRCFRVPKDWNHNPGSRTQIRNCDRGVELRVRHGFIEHREVACDAFPPATSNRLKRSCLMVCVYCLRLLLFITHSTFRRWWMETASLLQSYGPVAQGPRRMVKYSEYDRVSS